MTIIVYFDKFVLVLTSNIFMLFFLLVVSIFFLWKKKRRLFSLWISIATTSTVAVFLKFLVQRQRPITPEYFFGSIPDYSFPSLQTAVIFAALPLLWKEFSKLRYFILLYAILIALSRIYFQEHYLSDVISGMFIGLLIGLIIVYLTAQNKK